MTDPLTTPESQWDALAGAFAHTPAVSGWDVPASPAAAERHEARQSGVEEILERLKAAETRRAGAMARLEGMLNQWSDREPVSSTAARQSTPDAHPDDDHTPVVEPVLPAASSQHDEPTGVISIVRPTDNAAPLLAFESETVNRTQTAMFLRAHGISRRPDGQLGEVLPWRADASAGRERDEPPPQVEVSAPSSPQTRDAMQALSGRIDALELALVVAKGELERVSRRHALLQRRSLVSACLVLLCALLVGVLMVQSGRRIDDVRTQTTAAQKQADDATRQANELAATLKRVTDSNELIPR